jgi:hypothetical protein
MRMRASWFGSLRPTGYKVAARVPRARQRAPLGCVIPTTTSVPPCSGLSRCGLETTERAATAERRPTLTAPARAGLHHVRVGAKKRDSKSNKETGMKEVENGSNKRLTSTASYKDEGVGQSTNLQQPMPVAGVARQSRHLQTHYDPGTPQAHLGDQPLEAFTIC